MPWPRPMPHIEVPLQGCFESLVGNYVKEWRCFPKVRLPRVERTEIFWWDFFFFVHARVFKYTMTLEFQRLVLVKRPTGLLRCCSTDGLVHVPRCIHEVHVRV